MTRVPAGRERSSRSVTGPVPENHRSKPWLASHAVLLAFLVSCTPVAHTRLAQAVPDNDRALLQKLIEFRRHRLFDFTPIDWCSVRAHFEMADTAIAILAREYPGSLTRKPRWCPPGRNDFGTVFSISARTDAANSTVITGNAMRSGRIHRAAYVAVKAADTGFEFTNVAFSAFRFADPAPPPPRPTIRFSSSLVDTASPKTLTVVFSDTNTTRILRNSDFSSSNHQSGYFETASLGVLRLTVVVQEGNGDTLAVANDTLKLKPDQRYAVDISLFSPSPGIPGFPLGMRVHASSLDRTFPVRGAANRREPLVLLLGVLPISISNPSIF